MSMMQEIINNLFKKVCEGRYPCIGIFYSVNGKQILGRQARKPIDPATRQVLVDFEGLLYEHRDMWEDVVKSSILKLLRNMGMTIKLFRAGALKYVLSSAVSLSSALHCVSA